MDQPYRFTDRSQAGRLLAERVVAMGLVQPVVYALPRGGVPVAREIALALQAPLDLILVRKLGAPGAPELALGAVVDGDPPVTVINPDVQAMTGAGAAYLDRVRAAELAEIERRRARYLPGRARVAAAGRTAVVVDDGLATGATARAALTAIRQQGASRVVLAVPVAPVETLAEMEAFADDIVCLVPAQRFGGVGAFYDDFHQLGDAETVALLAGR